MMGNTRVRSTSSLLIRHEASLLLCWINILTIVTKVDIQSRACYGAGRVQTNNVFPAEYLFRVWRVHDIQRDNNLNFH